MPTVIKAWLLGVTNKMTIEENASRKVSQAFLRFYNKLCGKFKFHTAFFVIQSTKKAIPVKLISEQKNIRIGIALYGL